MSETLILNGKDLTLEDLYSVVYDRRPVQIDPEVIPLVDKSRQVLFDMAADGKPVYGLNHGVGWNKDREFSQDFFEQYNRNLINSHSLGVAPFASVEEVRAMMCIRLNTALCGRTGIASNILKMYEEFLNRGIHPRAMRRGAVGEGDVSTMSMIGQAMIGQGEVEYHGEIIPAIDAMRAEGIEPAILGPKDGLSIVSSNAQGESMVVLLVKEVEELIKLSDAIYCLHLEGLNGRSIVPQSAAASSRAAILSIPIPSARCRIPSPSAAVRPSTALSTILLSTSRISSSSRSTARTIIPASSMRREPHPSARTLR